MSLVLIVRVSHCRGWKMRVGRKGTEYGELGRKQGDDCTVGAMLFLWHMQPAAESSDATLETRHARTRHKGCHRTVFRK